MGADYRLTLQGLIDGILIIVAYILYPIVVVIFGFFYIFYGSILYIFGPIVIALMPLGGANRIAKSYIENIFIWNAWPILYGGFGALLSAVQMGQVGQMLSQNNFLGGLGNLEGSFLIGIVSIIYSLAIAVIPFIAKRIVSGDVGAPQSRWWDCGHGSDSWRGRWLEGAAAGWRRQEQAARRRSWQLEQSPAQHGRKLGHELTAASAGGEPTGAAATAAIAASHDAAASRLAEAARRWKAMRSRFAARFSDVMGPTAPARTQRLERLPWQPQAPASQDSVQRCRSERQAVSRSSAPARRGPSVHRYNLGTWSAYHAARIAARSLASVSRRATE